MVQKKNILETIANYLGMFAAMVLFLGKLLFHTFSNETHAFPPGLSRSIPGKEVTFQGCFRRDETDPSRIMIFCCEKKTGVFQSWSYLSKIFICFFPTETMMGDKET